MLKSKSILFFILAIILSENIKIFAQETTYDLEQIFEINQKSEDAFLNGDIPKAIKILEDFMDANDPYQIKSVDCLHSYLFLIIDQISDYAYMIQDHKKEYLNLNLIIDIVESKNLTENTEFKELYEDAKTSRISAIHIEGNKSIAKGKALSFDDLIAKEMYYTAKTLGYKRLKDGELNLTNDEKTEILNRLLLTHQILGEYDSCLNVINQLDELNEQNHYAFEKANIFFLMEKYDQATKLYDRIYATISIDNPNRSTIALQNGICSYKIGDFQKATRLLNDYSDMMAKVGYFAGSNWHFAYLNYEKGDYPEAIQYYKKAIDAVDANPIYKNEKEAYYEMVSQLSYGLALCYIGNNEPDDALESWRNSIEFGRKSIVNTLMFFTEKNRINYIKEYGKRGNEIYLFTHNVYPQYPEMVASAYDYTLMIKELGLNSVRNIRKYAAKQQDEEYKSIFNDWLSVNNQLTIPEPGLNKDSLMDLSRALEKELTTEAKSKILTNDKLEEISWKTLQQKLDANEAAIEFISFNIEKTQNSASTTQYAALVLKKGVKYPLYIPLCSEKKISNLITHTGELSETDRINEIYKKNGGELFQVLWAPLESSLKGINKIYYSPSGILHSLSFDAFPYSGGQYLSDKYNLVGLNNTRYIETEFDPSDINSTSLYGAMDYSDKLFYKNNKPNNDNTIKENTERSFNGLFTPLYATEKEVNTISSILVETGKRPVIYKKEDATEEKFYEEIYNAHEIIHLSTHAFYLEPVGDEELFATDLYGMSNLKTSDDPMNRSGIAFSGANYYWMNGEEYPGKMNGILTANEIANLDLSGTKLIVLSACETGKGENTKSEGVNGLQKAFKQAGVENLILSLWKVDDAATQQFMDKFYEYLLKDKLGIEESMQKAQANLREQYPDPYYWASFIYVR